MSACVICSRDFSHFWTAQCAKCKQNFDVDGDFCDENALDCPRCGVRSDVVLPDEPIQGKCKHCAGNRVDPNPELWRYMGCVCGNQEPELFRLLETEWPKRSYYCLDCKQPYSLFLWSNELPRDQCPRCNGPRIVIDAIEKGDTVIECLHCSSMVSKRRFDALSEEVVALCKEEKLGKQDVANLQVRCPHCNSSSVQLVVTECEGSPCVMQICSDCVSTDFVAGWNRDSDCIGLGEFERPERCDEHQRRGIRVPDGYEELVQCCGDLACLHPVEDDPSDELLVCARCHKTISIRACKDIRIPVTVSALRRELKGKFSQGKMGRPSGFVKVSSLDELKPADHVRFKRLMGYEHHAIVEKPVHKSEALSLIEYTGEFNWASIVAAVSRSKLNGCIKKTQVKFKGVAKFIQKVEYFSLDCYHPEAVLSRAEKLIGEKKYSVISRNCEHFSNWAKANVTFSRQVEAFKESARCILREAVVDISNFLDDLPKDGSICSAVIILQDIRAEMLRVLDRKKGETSIKDFWCPIRLVLKWAIRGIPLAFSKLFSKEFGCKMIWNLDGFLNTLGNAFTGAVLPTSPEDEKKTTKDDKEGK